MLPFALRAQEYAEQREAARYVDSVLHEAASHHFSNEDLFIPLTEALASAEAIPDSSYKLRCLYGLIWSHYYDGNYAEMIRFLRQSKSLAEQYGSPAQQLEWLNAMGYYWHENKEFRKSLSCQFDSFEILDQHPDSFLYSKVMNSIGIAYTQLGVLDSGMHYHRLNLPVRLKLGKHRYIGQTLYNIGEVFEQRRTYDSALFYYNAAQYHRSLDNYEQGLAWGYDRIGRTWLKKGMPDSAIANVRKAIRIVEDNNDHQAVCLFKTSLGEALIAADSISFGINECKESLHLSQSFTPEEGKLACLCLYKGYLASGDSASALKYHERYVDFKDSLELADQAVESTRLIMEAGFETRKEVYNQKLQQRAALIRQIIIGSALVLSVLVLLIYLIWRRWRAERERAEAVERFKNEELKAKIAEKEKEKARSLLKAVEQEKDILSKELHDGFGSLLYGSILQMQSSIRKGEADSIEQTVDGLKKGYEQLRSVARQLSKVQAGEFASLNELVLNEIDVYESITDIEFDLNASEEIPSQGDLADTHLVRSLQTLINNVIRHSKAKQCKVTLEQAAGMIRIHIDDDGVGMDKRKGSFGSGLKNVNERMEALGGRLEISAQKDGGTRATLLFPELLANA